MKKNYLSVAGLSTFGYLFTFLNQILISYYYGTSEDIDAYYLVLAVLQMVVFFIGPIRDALIPEFHDLLHRNQDDAFIFFSKIFNLIILVLAVSMVCVLCFPQLFSKMIISNGQMSLQGAFQRLILVMSPFLVLFAITELLNGILISYNNVLIQSTGRVLNAAIVALCICLLSAHYGILAMITGTIAGQIGIVAIQTRKLAKNRFRYRVAAFPGTEKKFLSLSSAVLFAHMMAQLYMIVEKNTLTHFGKGVVSGYQYGFSLTQVPQMIFITSLSIVIWPLILGSIHDKNMYNMWHQLVSALKLLCVILGYVTTFCVLFSDHLIYLLYYRGAFDIQSLHMTSTCFKVTVLSLLPAGFIALTTRVLISLKAGRSLLVCGISGSTAGIAILIIARLCNLFDVALLHLLGSTFTGMLITIILLDRMKLPDIHLLLNKSNGYFIGFIFLLSFAFWVVYPVPTFQMTNKLDVFMTLIPHFIIISIVYLCILFFTKAVTLNEILAIASSSFGNSRKN